MSDQSPLPSPSKLPHLVREKYGSMGAALAAWKAELRENPTQFLSSPLFRIPLWIVVGVVLLLLGKSAISAWTPTQAGKNFETATTTATIYVACTDPACLHTFNAQVPMDWKGGAVACAKCGKPTAVRAKLCDKCRHWYGPSPTGPTGCPHCAAKAAAASKPVRKKSSDNPDDREDGW